MLRSTPSLRHHLRPERFVCVAVVHDEVALEQDSRHAKLGSPGRCSIEDHRRPRKGAVRNSKVEGAAGGLESRVRDLVLPEDVELNGVGLLVYDESDHAVRVLGDLHYDYRRAA